MWSTSSLRKPWEAVSCSTPRSRFRSPVNSRSYRNRFLMRVRSLGSHGSFVPRFRRALRQITSTHSAAARSRRSRSRVWPRRQVAGTGSPTVCLRPCPSRIAECQLHGRTGFPKIGIACSRPSTGGPGASSDAGRVEPLETELRRALKSAGQRAAVATGKRPSRPVSEGNRAGAFGACW